MKDSFVTIRAKLTGLIFLVVFFGALMAVLSNVYLNKIHQAMITTGTLGQLQTRLFEIKNAQDNFLYQAVTDEAFFNSGQSAQVDEFNNISTDVLSKIKSLQGNKLILKEDQTAAIVNQLYASQEQYKSLFEQTVASFKKRGTMNYGLIGQINDELDKLTAQAGNENIPGANQALLNLVRAEKNYLLSNDQLYLDKLNAQIDKMSTLTEANGQPVAGMTANLAALRTLTRQLESLDQNIGFNDIDEGLISKLDKSINTAGNETEKLSDELKSGVLKASNRASTSLLIIILLLTVFISALLIITINTINRPLKSLHGYLKELVKGKLPKMPAFRYKDEIAEMGTYLEKFVTDLRQKSEYTQLIGKNQLDAEYAPLSDDDILGNSLLQLREDLKVARDEEVKYKEEEEKRRWTNEGLALFADVLRQHNDNMSLLSDNIIQNLVNYLEANQGGLFLYKENEDEEDYLELASAFAYNRKKYLEKQIKIGEGLVGTCAIEKEKIYLTQLPEDYINITSGLGDATPKALLLVPLKLEEEVMGVIEIASFNEFSEHEVDFVEKIAQSIASTLSTAKINEKTTLLLEQSNKQAEEMAQQEEEMRQNMEELQATQEDLKRQMESNKDMQQELVKEKALLDSLMAFLPDFIYFKDEQSKFIRISQSMLKLFPVNNIDEMIGKSDFDFQAKEAAQQYYDEEMEIIKTGKGFVDHLQHEVMPNGLTQWTSVTKLPLYDENGKCIGTFGISKNVTEYKQLEAEATQKSEELLQEKALLDSLLDSLPDLVYFKDRDSKFLNLSKSMLRISPFDTIEEMIGKSDFDFQLKESAQQYFEEEQEIINTGKGFVDIVRKEVWEDGTEQWSSTTKLPMYNAKGECIGTFGITKDITEVKILEIEAKSQSEELKAQEEEMRQNMEEMMATQEEAERREAELSGIVSAVDATNMVIEYSSEGKIVKINDLLLKTLHYNKSDLLGKNNWEFTGDDKNGKDYQQLWEDLNKGSRKEVNQEIKDANGKIHKLKMVYSPVKDKSGNVSKIICLALDGNAM
ncbi:MAG TPA: PAS domain-containing protein [Bacteroidales bacterium]|nr:PAS domain-containing protein [Bacteroidales bacterium]